MWTALDPWEGLYERPMSLNGYSWVEGNPVNLTDPSGEGAVLPLLVAGAATIAQVVLLVLAAEQLAKNFTCIFNSHLPACNDPFNNPITMLERLCVPAIQAMMSVVRQDEATQTQTQTPSQTIPELSDPDRNRMQREGEERSPRPDPGPLYPPGLPPNFDPPRRPTPRVVVELGAGFYTNAIRNKTTNPSWQMYATNKHSQEAARLISIYEQKGIQDETDFTRIIRGFYAAKNMGIIVGEQPAYPLSNDMVVLNVADIVYVIAPWPGLIEQGKGIVYGYGMGFDAGRIAKSSSGTDIYIATESIDILNDFRNGVINSGHLYVWRDDDLFRYGDSDYTIITIAQTCTVP